MHNFNQLHKVLGIGLFKRGWLSGILFCAMLSCLLLLNGCATLTKEECLIGNWQAIGFADGAAGKTSAQLSNHSKACAKAGVAPDYKAWELGRQQGLKQYCTPTKAYQIGRRGYAMSPVCPANMVAKLEHINADGRQHHKLTTELEKQQDNLEQYQQELDKLLQGDNLEFTSELKAREYLAQLPQKQRLTQKRINELERTIRKIERDYGY